MGEVNDVLFHPSGKFFFTAGMDKKVKMWSLDRGNHTKKFIYFYFLREKSIKI